MSPDGYVVFGWNTSTFVTAQYCNNADPTNPEPHFYALPIDLTAVDAYYSSGYYRFDDLSSSKTFLLD